jgi:protein phosphatase
MTTWRYAASTDVGLVREINEDSLRVDSTLAIVADGMGGHAAGEVASAIAVEEITRGFAVEPTGPGLVRAVLAANEAILADARAHPERVGMGTTVVVLGLTETGDGVLPVVVNVGDSRAYQLRDGALRQITADHSVAEEWVRQGRLTPEEAAAHPRRHQLTRTLGLEVDVEPDVFRLAVQPGDRILLCSDGLSNELSDHEIAEAASAPNPLEEAVATLVASANHHGGRDNITAVLVEFDEAVAVPRGAEGDLVGFERPGEAAQRPAAAVTPRARVRRGPRFTWRTALFILALLGVLAGGYAVLDWYEGSTFYLATGPSFDGTHTDVIIYQGQPSGLLWFHPTKLIDTGVPLGQLPVVDQGLLVQPITEPTSQIALNQVLTWNRFWKQQHHLTSTTTTTTTTTTTSPGHGG